MRSKTQIIAAMKYLAAKHPGKLAFKEIPEIEYLLYRKGVSFHGTIIKLTRNGQYYDVLDLSSKLEEIV